MSAPQPILEGKKNAPKDEEQKEKQLTEIEINALKDLHPPIPSEEEKPSRDVQGDTSLEKKAQIHQENIESAVLQKQKASASNSKKTITERKRREKADGKNGAQGTPAPDVLTEFSHKMNAKFDEILQALHDVKRVRALETSSQSIGEKSNIQTVQNISIPNAQPDEIIPVPVSKRIREEYPSIEPVPMKQQFPRESVDPEDYDYFAKKFKRTNQNIEFYDRDLRQRAQQDQTSGQRPSASQNQSQVFLF